MKYSKGNWVLDPQPLVRYHQTFKNAVFSNSIDKSGVGDEGDSPPPPKKDRRETQGQRVQETLKYNK